MVRQEQVAAGRPSSSNTGPHIIFVLGVHRSGTSAVAGALAAAGVACGGPLLPANEGNPKGYWELEPLVALNDRIFAALNRRWYDIAPMPAGWAANPAVRQLEGDARQLLRSQLSEHAIGLLKDPRLCLTMPFWRNVMTQLGWPLSVIVIARPVDDVVLSLQRRELLRARDIACLWARSMLEAVRACFYDRSLLTTYDQLIESPREVFERISARLDFRLDLPTCLRSIDATLRHHRAAPACDAPEPILAFCAQLYRAIAESAAQGAGLGAAPFRQAEAEMAAIDAAILPGILQEDLFRVREERNALLLENAAARENVDRLVAEVASARDVNGALQKEISAARDLNEGLVAEIAGAREVHTALVSENDAARRNVDSLVAELDSARRTIEGLLAERDAARENIEGLVAENARARDTNSAVVAEVDAARRTNEGLVGELDAARVNIDRLTAENAQARDANSALVSEIDSARRNIADLVAQVEAARTANEGLVAEVAAAGRNIDGLVAEIDAARRTIDGLVGELASAREAHASRDRVEEELRSRLASLEASVKASSPGGGRRSAS